MLEDLLAALGARLDRIARTRDLSLALEPGAPETALRLTEALLDEARASRLLILGPALRERSQITRVVRDGLPERPSMWAAYAHAGRLTCRR